MNRRGETPDSVLNALLPATRACMPLVALLIAVAHLHAQTGSPAGVGVVRGTVYDSVHASPLARAILELEPTGRETTTSEIGEFRFDSVPALVNYQVRVRHAMLDTVGISLVTPQFTVKAAEIKVWTLAVPSSVRLVSLFCAAPMLARGPSALVGFVRDPDSGAPIDSVTVSLVYEDALFGLAKRPVRRDAKPDAAGRYKICGLPAQVTGRVQLLRNGTQSADIPVTTDANAPLALRSLGMSLSTQHIQVGTDSVGRSIRILRGTARLTGRVTSKSGAPVVGARVQMDATKSAMVTGNDGRFALDSLPTGTQNLTVRKIGYSVTDIAVDVSANGSAPVTVVMADYIPTLATVVTTAQRDADMQRIGYTRRKQTGAGYYRDGDQIDHAAANVVDLLSQMPGLTSNQGTLASSRGVDACVTILVDGVVWQDDPASGSIQDFVRPEELQAIELYSASSAPPDFAVPAFSACQVLALWTSRRIHPGKTTRPPSF
jgi:carboxypeptidase family protein